MEDPRDQRPSALLASLPTSFRDDARRLAETFDYVDRGLWDLARSVRVSRDSMQRPSIESLQAWLTQADALQKVHQDAVAGFGALLAGMNTDPGARAQAGQTREYFVLLLEATQDAQQEYQTVVNSLTGPPATSTL